MATIVINRVTGVYLIPVIMNMVVICTNKTGCKPGRQHVDPWKCDIGMSTIYYVFICMHNKGTFRQIVEIPMRKTGAPFIGVLFLYWF